MSGWLVGLLVGFLFLVWYKKEKGKGKQKGKRKRKGKGQKKKEKEEKKQGKVLTIPVSPSFDPLKPNSFMIGWIGPLLETPL